MSTVLRYGRTIIAATFCAALVACETTTGTQVGLNGSMQDRDYCEERPLVCALIGAVVIGGVVAIASNGGGGGGGGAGESDIRLKADVRFVEQLENGINLYAFRYTGDERMFVGVNAAEIHADPRHRHAAVELEGNFLGVDYQALGLEVVNEAEMREAGRAALARALAA